MGPAGMLGAVTISDWATVGLFLVAVPSAIVAWNNVVDRRQRHDQRREQAEQRALIEMIGRAFFGPNPDRWPKPGRGDTSMGEMLEQVSDQLRPSNGKTVAKQIEETNREIGRVAVLMGEHMSDGHGAQVWPSGR